MPNYTRRQISSLARLSQDNDFEEFINILQDRYNSRIVTLLGENQNNIVIDMVRGRAAELSEIIKLITSAVDTLMDMERRDRESQSHSMAKS